MPMKLDALIADLDLTLTHGSADVDIAELTDDSRQVEHGMLFIARTGPTTDGQAFIADALKRGAVAIIAAGDPPADLPEHVAWVRGSKVDQTLAGELAERFFGRPSSKLKLVGITGTNGKTTTAGIVQHLLTRAGVKCGQIGTVTIDDGSGNPKVASLTTPGSIEFSRILSHMVANGCKAAVAEVSSHALHQGRTAALQFAVGVFTNLTGDHLDYHGTMEAYAAAKGLLFKQLGENGYAVINADDRHAVAMVHQFAGPQSHIFATSVSRQSPNGDKPQATRLRPGIPSIDTWKVGQPPTLCTATIAGLTAAGSEVRFDGPWGSVELMLPLAGRHNVSNALQAAAAAHAVADMTKTLSESLAACPAVPGRLERVTLSAEQMNGDADALPTVLVDYAHTHDALANVLTALRQVTQGRLRVLFGCGGDRDRTKRPRMAQVACRLADVVWITSDNPRTEDPQAIIDDVLAGVPDAMRQAQAEDHAGGGGNCGGYSGSNSGGVRVQVDRAAAILGCIGEAQPGDTVLLAGKGHEDYQIVGKEKRHFDDREQAAAALTRWCEQRK